MEYELTTIKDIFDKVPSDRIRTCLHELGIAMEQAKAMAELLGATTEAVTGVSDGVDVRWPETSTWIDDGKGTLDLQFRTEDGNDGFDYTVQLAGYNAGIQRPASAGPLE